MTGVELLQNGIGRTLGFLGRAGAMISITLLSRAEDEPEYQIHIDTGVSILLNGVAYTSSAEINDDMPYGVCEFDQKAAALLASGDAFRLERLSYDEAYLLHVIFDNGLELHTRSTPGLCEEMADFPELDGGYPSDRIPGWHRGGTAHAFTAGAG